MSAHRTYALLERIATLLRNDERASGSPRGLQPVHLHALGYLAACNRYSNTPAALAEYLGLTKGTVSQTLLVLENKGLLTKQGNPEDRRVVHLHLTPEGRKALEEAIPSDLFRRALSAPGLDRGGLEQQLTRLLQNLQAAHGQRAFGQCDSCRHFQKEGPGRYRCGITQDPLSREDSALLCRDHAVAGT